MWLEIQARQNFGTVAKPKIGVMLTNPKGDLVQPKNGLITEDQSGRLFRVCHKPEYGVWVELIPSHSLRG